MNLHISNLNEIQYMSVYFSAKVDTLFHITIFCWLINLKYQFILHDCHNELVALWKLQINIKY